MKRRKTYKKIISSAGKLFAQRGYFGVSLSQIAQKAGITKAGLYYYFDSKEELYLAVLQETFSSLFTHLQNAVSLAPTPLAKLFNVIEAYLTFTLHRPEVILLTDHDWAEESIVFEFTSQARQQLIQFITNLIRTLGKGVEVSEAKIVFFLSLLLEIIHWPFLLALTTPKKLAEEMINFFFPQIVSE